LLLSAGQKASASVVVAARAMSVHSRSVIRTCGL
jgi:hypothetical protein